MFENLIAMSLDEDIGSGDITTASIIYADKNGKAEVYAKQDLILAGIEIFKRVFSSIAPSFEFTDISLDGRFIKKGDKIVSIAGPLSSLLTGERTALNFIQRMSGIATTTYTFVKEVEGTGVIILDTRKTIPGWRRLEKYAVLQGGGQNHRFGLYDRVIIKDNHIEAAGGISNAVNMVRKNQKKDIKIEVETESLDDVHEALNAGVDIIMLDNMSISKIRYAITLINGRAEVEVSGNVTIDNVRRIAETGATYISAGAITHSAPFADISMKIL